MVTIAIPFYNSEYFFEYAIKSVINQTYKDWVLLLVDDGSTDTSMDIAKKYETLDSRIKVICDGENRQLPYRLNQIAEITTTKYLARMDADDIMFPERISKQVEVMEANPEIDVLGTNAFVINEYNEIMGVRLPINNELEKVSIFIHPTVMGKTQWFRNNNYDERAIRIEDAELWDRTFAHSLFMRLNEPLLFYREFGGNYYEKYKKAQNTFIYISKKYFSEMKIKKSLFWIIKGGRFYLKSLCYYFLNKLSQENILISRRYISIKEDNKNYAKQNLLKATNNTCVKVK